MVQRNMDIRQAIKKSNLFVWQVAEKLGVHENTFYRTLRKELSSEEKQRIMTAISEDGN